MTYKRSPLNTRRENWADAAVVEFARLSGMEYEDDQTRLADLLCDLMHWAAYRAKAKDCPVNFENAMYTATANFEAEAAGKEF